MRPHFWSTVLSTWRRCVSEMWFHCWRNMVSLLERNQRWNMVANKIGGYRRLPEAPGGDLKWALAKHWVSETRVGQCLGASWDALKSRYVPYLFIRGWFWSVRAWKEKFPPLIDIGLPPDFHKKSGGEPVYLAPCLIQNHFLIQRMLRFSRHSRERP